LRNVKIATAIIRFIIPSISYATPLIARISFIKKPRSISTDAFMMSETAHMSTKYKGRVRIFKTGFTNALSNQRIIHPIR